MKLDFNEIRSITSGAVRILETEEGISFNRFTEEQEEVYRRRTDNSHDRALCTAGIVFRFQTDSKFLSLKVDVQQKSGWSFFGMDILVDGRRVACICNFNEDELPPDYSVLKFMLGEFSKTVPLGDGEKTVELHFPYNQKAVIKELCIEDGAFIKPIKRSRRALVYGDSITQGMHALHPSVRYAARLCEYLNAEEYCKAISGAAFNPALSELRDDFVPDIITVSYGTNDWDYGTTPEQLENNCRQFCLNLRRNYPTVPMIVLTPVWRKDYNKAQKAFEFSETEGIITKAIQEIDNVTLISGKDFMPKDTMLYGDLYLHPNDKGFGYFTKNLLQKLEEVF